MKGEPRRGPSPHSSFVLRFLRTSSNLWFTMHSCSLRELVEYKESVSGSESYGLTHWVRALDAWLRCPNGPDPNPGRNGVDCQRSGSSEAADFVAALLLSGTGRLPEVVGSAVG
ncbi:hypothetical protein BHE74_00004527 [Ensete ventricosum]|nr:hypothetical protein BHE74_00004527 [Ensete ventricosum]